MSMNVPNPKKVLVNAKNHVSANKAAYVAGTIAVLAIALQQRNRFAFNEFLTEKGIDLDEYYCPEAYEERMNAE
jgi:hypothetical protein